MRHSLWRYIALISITFLTAPLKGQVNLNGLIYTSEDSILTIGATIQEVGVKENYTFSDFNGSFEISLKSDTSMISIQFVGCQELIVRIDTVDLNNGIFYLDNDPNLEDVIVYCTTPPYIEFGYLSTIDQFPIGLQASIAAWGDRKVIALDFSTYNFEDFSLFISSGPYRISNRFHRMPELFPLIMLENLGGDLKGNYILAAKSYVHWNFNVNYGIGLRSSDNVLQAYYLIGGEIQKYIDPIDISLELTGLFNQYEFEWYGIINVEFMAWHYKAISTSLGYQSIFDRKSLVVNLNFKYYFVDRKNK